MGMQEETMKKTIWHMIRRERIHIEKRINTFPALPEESTQITVMSLITYAPSPPFSCILRPTNESIHFLDALAKLALLVSQLVTECAVDLAR